MIRLSDPDVPFTRTQAGPTARVSGGTRGKQRARLRKNAAGRAARAAGLQPPLAGAAGAAAGIELNNLTKTPKKCAFTARALHRRHPRP